VLSAIAVLEEDRFAPVAALGHVMGQIGNDDAGEAGHGQGLAQQERNVNGRISLQRG
jgi:hypothetical protein